MSHSQTQFLEKDIGRMSSYEKNIGKQGEKLAARYLNEKRGMEIIEKNWFTNHGEIDIIAKDGDCTVFVEVKTRTSSLYGSGTEAITRKKQAALLRAAEVYAVSKGILDTPMRFDVIEIAIEGEKTLLRYFKNAEIGW